MMIETTGIVQKMRAHALFTFWGDLSHALAPEKLGARLHKDILWNGHNEAESRVVALTFDDGPHYNTPQILDTLASYDVKASFFVVGNRLQNPYYAQLLQDIIDQGHLVGNHTWSHADMSNLRQVTSESELRKTRDYISQLTQYEMQFMRPPFGKLSLDAALASWTFDYTIAMWNLDSHDYRSTSQWSAQQQLDKIQEAFNSQSPDDSSHILLLHDYSSQTLENLSAIIESALDAGYRIGTMEDCLKL